MKDDWCWERSFIDVDVGAEDLKGILFVQKGYWVNIISTHDVDSYLTQPNGSNMNLKIQVIECANYSPYKYVGKVQLLKIRLFCKLQKGSQQICVEYPGVHELHFKNSCIFFGSSSIKIDTSNLLVWTIYIAIITFSWPLFIGSFCDFLPLCFNDSFVAHPSQRRKVSSKRPNKCTV